MKRTICFAFVAGVAFVTNAANILWGHDSTYYVSGWNVYEWTCMEDTKYFLSIFFKWNNGDFSIDHIGWEYDNAAVMVRGAVIDDSTVFDEVFPTGSMAIGDEGLYLGYKARSSDLQDESDSKCAYGWVYFTKNDTGTLDAEYAFDLDGGGMYIGGGAVPEPNSCALFLIGTSLLALCRRRSCRGSPSPRSPDLHG